MSSSSPIIFITGANTGLGLEIVKSLVQSTKTYTILLGGRSIEKANAAAQEVHSEFPQSSSLIKTLQIDIEDDDSIQAAFKHIESTYGHLDVLINNAGGQFDQEVMKANMSMREMWNKSWNVNVTGTNILTHNFTPLLLQSSDPRLLFITSGTSTLGESENTALKVNEPPAKGWPKQGFAVPAYRSAKTGLNMMMREWYRMLKNDGVKVWGVSPGYLATGLGVGKELNKKMGAIEPSIGADFVRSVVEGERDGDVGKVIRKDDTQAW